MKSALSELHIFTTETVRPPVRWSNELALEHLAEQPALMEKRLAEIEAPAKSDVRFGPIADSQTSRQRSYKSPNFVV